MVIVELCLWCLSAVNKTNVGIMKAIIADNRQNRRESLEKVIHDGRRWLKTLQRREFENGKSFDEYYVLKIGNTLQQFSKDWNGYYDFLTKAAVVAQEEQLIVSEKDYRDILAEVRQMSLKYEEDFNKAIAFEMIHKIYQAMENRIGN